MFAHAFFINFTKIQLLVNIYSYYLWVIFKSNLASQFRLSQFNFDSFTLKWENKLFDFLLLYKILKLELRNLDMISYENWMILKWKLKSHYSFKHIKISLSDYEKKNIFCLTKLFTLIDKICKNTIFQGFWAFRNFTFSFFWLHF
jgi:hypothetical protein